MSKRILVVEDDASVRELLQHFFQAEGFFVGQASSGAEALQRLEAEDYDLLILDLMLPGTSGIEVVRELQALGRKAPVLIITGKSMDPQTEQVFRQEPNVADFIRKPLHYQQVVEKVRGILK